MPDGRVWLITGCSRGFGRELARQVLARGERAVVTARDPADVADLARTFADRALALALDLTDPAAVAAAVDAAQARFGRIDILVNNAGQGFVTSIEEAPDPDVRALFELNFFGLLALTRAVLPGMRARRAGHIVNLSSTGGRLGRAGSGIYAATKFAVEGLSEALAQEVGPLGIHVTIVEPGGFRTGFIRTIRRQEIRIEDYRRTVGPRAAQILDPARRPPGDPAAGARAILAAVDAPAPPLRLVLGADAWKSIHEGMEAARRELQAWRAVSEAADG